MKNIYEYIQLPKAERQAHLKLEEPCIERGAGSFYFKGLLAHVLDTTVPSGKKIHLCHACHNGDCGNPNHLYWGTSQENRIDQVSNGGKTVWERTVEKYGLEEAKKLNSKNKLGNQGGAGNKGKTKSEEHKKKIAESVKRRYNLKNADVM
jgi:hypothetical protein